MQDQTTIYFIRHGEVENPKQIIYGRRNFPLSNHGQSQMERLAKYLKSLKTIPDIIYTSPLERGRQSTEKLHEEFSSILVVEDERLQEIDVGALYGRSIAWNNSIQRDVYTFAKNNGLRIEFPESIIKRMMVVLNDALEKHKGKTIFVMSHGDPITFLLWRLLHPNSSIPSYVYVTKGNFLREAQAWEMIFDAQGKLMQHMLISTT